MQAVISTVKWAKAKVDGQVVAHCGVGYILLVEGHAEDTPDVYELISERVIHMQLFYDFERHVSEGLWQLPPTEEPEILAISYFSLLHPDWRFMGFKDRSEYEPLDRGISDLVNILRAKGRRVSTVEFGTMVVLEFESTRSHAEIGVKPKKKAATDSKPKKSKDPQKHKTPPGRKGYLALSDYREVRSSSPTRPKE
jgi:D-Tyr-tRNAtyr deacylase